MMTMLRLGHVRSAWRRVRLMPPSRTMAVCYVVLRVLQMLIENRDLVVQLVPLLAAVVLEASYRLDTAQSSDGEGDEQEDGTAVALFFVHPVVE